MKTTHSALSLIFSIATMAAPTSSESQTLQDVREAIGSGQVENVQIQEVSEAIIRGDYEAVEMSEQAPSLQEEECAKYCRNKLIERLQIAAFKVHQKKWLRAEVRRIAERPYCNSLFNIDSLWGYHNVSLTIVELEISPSESNRERLAQIESRYPELFTAFTSDAGTVPLWMFYAADSRSVEAIQRLRRQTTEALLALSTGQVLAIQPEPLASNEIQAKADAIITEYVRKNKKSR